MKYICSQGFIYIAMYFMRFCCSIAGSVPKHLMSSSASKIAEMNLKSWLTEQHMMEAGISDRPGMVTEQGSSECHGSTHSWPGSKLGLAPIRCCRTRPQSARVHGMWDHQRVGPVVIRLISFLSVLLPSVFVYCSKFNHLFFPIKKF